MLVLFSLSVVCLRRVIATPSLHPSAFPYDDDGDDDDAEDVDEDDDDHGDGDDDYVLALAHFPKI